MHRYQLKLTDTAPRLPGLAQKLAAFLELTIHEASANCTLYGDPASGHLKLTHRRDAGSPTVDPSDHHELLSHDLPVVIRAHSMSWIWGDDLSLRIESQDEPSFARCKAWLVETLAAAGVSADVLARGD